MTVGSTSWDRSRPASAAAGGRALVASIALCAACHAPADVSPTEDVPPDVRISEVHYHPVLEGDYVERHEFIELYGAQAVDLGGWQLAADFVRFTFPEGASIGEGQYLVVARDRAALAQVWGLDPSTLQGDYEGELDNGRDTLRLLAPDGEIVDVLAYDDDAPWPVAPDALGAGERWLDPSLLPLSAHRYRGHSLERIRLDLPTSEVSNWAPSPLDGSTPGAAYALAGIDPPAIVVQRTVSPVASELQVRIVLSGLGPASDLALEWFVDDVSREDEARQVTSLAPEGPSQFVAMVPAVSPGVVVRYRILADRGAGREVISPRATDPYRWHAYALTPSDGARTRTYHLYISPASWAELLGSSAPGRDDGCTVNPDWNHEVPAVLLFDDQVYDVRARFQGSRFNRTGGPQIDWPYPGPAGQVNVLSWRLSFPRYQRQGRRSVLTLNKNLQGCPGHAAGVGFQLFRSVGVPAPETRFARLFINGGYYHYMLEIERPDDDMMAKWGEVGDLFKSVGQFQDGGAYGIGDERPLSAACGLSADQRYALTYDRKTQTSWGAIAPLRDLLVALAQARAAGPAAERAFFEQHFDVPALTSYLAVMNWGVPFDDMFQNHFLYRRRDGRWQLLPWDLDLDFGGWNGPEASLYLGEYDDPDNRSGWANDLKDAFFDCCRAEFDARLRALVEAELSPARVAPIVDAFTATGDLAEAAAAPAGLACDGFAPAGEAFKSFAAARQDVVRQRLP